MMRGTELAVSRNLSGDSLRIMRRARLIRPGVHVDTKSVILFDGQGGFIEAPVQPIVIERYSQDRRRIIPFTFFRTKPDVVAGTLRGSR